MRTGNLAPRKFYAMPAGIRLFWWHPMNFLVRPHVSKPYYPTHLQDILTEKQSKTQMEKITIHRHSVIGPFSMKYLFESSETAIADTWSPLKKQSVGNYTIEMKDVAKTEIELSLLDSEREREWAEQATKSHFLIVSAKDGKLFKLLIECIRSVTEHSGNGEKHYFVEYVHFDGTPSKTDAYDVMLI